MSRDIPAAIRTLESALDPAPRDVMARCLASLALRCAPRPGTSEAEWTARHAEYMRKLAHYPADVWQQACDAWTDQPPEKGNWYPTESELGHAMRCLTDERRRRIDRLRRIAELAKAPKPEEAPKRYCDLTPEQKAEFDAQLARLRVAFPDRTPEPVLRRPLRPLADVTIGSDWWKRHGWSDPRHTDAGPKQGKDGES